MGFQDTMKALADPVRREILEMLKGGKKSAGEIGEKFDMTGATISYHLSILKKAELVKEQKVKNFIYYEINASIFEEIMIWASQFRPEGNQDKPEWNQVKPEENQDTPEGNQDTPEGNQDKPDENQDKPEENQDTLEGNQVKP